MEQPYIVSNTIKYSDGTETTVNYSANADSEAIEQIVAENIESNNIEETPIVEPIVAPEASQDESEVSDVQSTDETVA